LKHNIKSADLKRLHFDASFQQILTSELKILWEARSTPTLAIPQQKQISVGQVASTGST
jgi:hypothetical protein